MTKMIMLVAALALAAASGCGDDGDDGDGDGSSSGESSSSGGSSGETCDEKHSCINGACQCDAGPKQGQSCCDLDDANCTTDKCDSFCKYCS